MSVGLSWKLIFGQAGVGYAQPYIFNSKSRVVQEKVILNQPHEALKSTLEIRCGDLGKLSSPGSRAKADARDPGLENIARKVVLFQVQMHLFRNTHIVNITS